MVMFNMISEKEYNRYIYNTISELIFDCGDSYQDKFVDSRADNLPVHIREILAEISDIYDYDMTKKFLINLDFIFTWQESITGSVNEEAAIVAAEYIIFCCVVDKILDSDRFSKDVKRKLLQYIGIESFSYHIPLNIEETEFQCIFKLVMDIRAFLRKYAGDKADNVMKDIDKALRSECFMSFHDLQYSVKEDEQSFLIDKSVSFESSAVRLGVLPYDSDPVVQADTIGEIFWLIDDICDLLDDYKSNRINSLLYYNNPEYKIADRLIYAVNHIDFYIELLNVKIALLKQSTDNTVYEYMKEQIWWWLSGARRISCS